MFVWAAWKLLIFNFFKKIYNYFLSDADFFYESPKQDSLESSDDVKTGPYLCTGYHVYLTREPCVMYVLTFSTGHLINL